MVILPNIEAVIYDMDGTIIDTEQFHVKAWALTSQIYSLGFSGEQLYAASKGISSKKTLERVLPLDRYGIIDEAAEAKFQYMMKLMENEPVSLLSGFEETFERLQSYDLELGICTSARKENVEALLRNRNSPISKILDSLEGKIAWKEMFTKGKPDAEPLLVALNLLSGVSATNMLYVGDALADYGCAKNVGASFVYFCPDGVEREKEMPVDVSMIRDHRELLRLIKFY